MEVVLINKDAHGGLETEVPLILDAAIVHMLSIEKLSIALIPPSHPIIVLPVLHGAPRSNSLAVVTLNELLKTVNTQRVHQVLHACIGPDITVAMITLRCQNGLQYLRDILLGDEAHVIGRTGKGVLLVMGTTHASADHDIESLELAGFIANYNTANVIGVNVQRVVAGNRHANLELSWQILRAVNRLDGITKNNPTSIVVQHLLVNVVMFHLLRPSFDGGGLLAIEPNFRKGGSHGTKKMGEHLGIFPGVIVRGRVEGSGSRHDITGNIPAGSDGGGANVHDGGNDGFEVAL
mmetsp:Transcript_15821/g.34242  ORF Transcript_15821/g.34242 Transcript_15821/m.34242 type:complete len:293 (-) Transcript_15821:635-1513(-)